MLHETVKFTKTDGSTFVANVDGMVGLKWIVRFKDDKLQTIDMSEIVKFERVDEDDHQEFTMAFLYERKHNQVLELASHVLHKFDEIINYCPEDHDTLFEQFEIDFKALIQARKDSN